MSVLQPQRRAMLGVVLLTTTSVLAPQQADKLAVRITSPQQATFVSGPVLIRAEVTPAASVQVTKVTFYVDDAVVGSKREPPWEVNWDAGATFARHLIRVEAVDASGASSEDAVVTRDLETAVFRAEVEVVPLFVTVEDDQGRYIPGLTVEDFEVYEDKKPQAIRYFDAEPRPMAVGLLIDTSGSMAGAKMKRAKQGALAFLKQLGPADQAFVMAFDAFPRLTQDLTPNHRLLREAVSKLKPRGATSLNLAIVEGSDILVEQPERRALVILSDGFDTVQSVTEGQAVEYARRQDTRLYTIGIFETAGTLPGPGRGGFDSMNRGEVTLRAYSDGTGGRTILLSSLGELIDAYAQIAAELRSQYALAYRPDNPPQPGEWREIEVRTRRGKARTKPGYYGSQQDG
ncbi:MAG: VWA domain-containing protein [Acidobacteriota bacterium]